ncbi:MAG: class I SAM-dependent methyltransferase [Hyphomonadaceae bacterium]
MHLRKAGLKASAGALVALLALAACSETTDTAAPTESAETAAPAPAPDYAALLTAPGRPADDAADDEARKTAETLAFIGLLPGDAVLELEAGSGYYTELFAGAVGPDGKVLMQNPPEFDSFAGEAVEARLADNRLPNVTLVKTHFDQLDAPDNSVDVVTWVLGPHELFYKTDAFPDGLGDVQTSYAEVFRVLKPGGRFIVLDHAAAAGAGSETGGTLHRIDPAIVKADAAAAGFAVGAESDLLANPEDDHTKMVFDPSVRRHTDQFLVRFVKPAS